ncbi:hypothetical protein C8J57DRAFT_1074970, partial [Mycena rebaudengoi]
YGKRICPGKDLAEDAVFLCAAMTLSIFNLKSDVTEPQYTSGPVSYVSELCLRSGCSLFLASHPLPFACDIGPRSREAEALVLHTAASGY